VELNDDVREAIASSALAHVVTVDPDGAPQVTLAWVGLDGDDVVIGTLFDQRKLQNLRRDPRVAISIERGRRNEHGLDEYVVLHGRARVEAGGAPELLQRLAATYLGPDVKFPPMDDPPPGYTVRITVERVGGVGAAGPPRPRAGA
jgi:PPOX class probable F420-dependent enzyme